MSGCNSCAIGDADHEGGCNNNGGCSTGGCNRLNVFDWLSDMNLPVEQKFDVVEVRFKSGRKDFFRNKESLALNTGDSVVVDVPNGHHLGFVSLQGELVRLQMKKKSVTDDNDLRQIYRIATQKDTEKYEAVRGRELKAMFRSRELIKEIGLTMKLTDVEFQADETKATFFYSAEERVDFRELIKVLATEFRIRIEMRQISLRQEAARIGGIGSCGRELCCSTWLSSFKSVSTSAARYQNLSLNPSKLSGQCGRLKCCLNYELDTYMDALKDIPEIKKPLKTENGEAYLQKTDIFRKIMWFGYSNENSWHPISIERVQEIIEMNVNGELPESLALDKDYARLKQEKAISNDLERLDQKYKLKSKGSKKSNKSGKERHGRNNKKQPQSNKESRNEPVANSNQKPVNNTQRSNDADVKTNTNRPKKSNKKRKPRPPHKKDGTPEKPQ